MGCTNSMAVAPEPACQMAWDNEEANPTTIVVKGTSQEYAFRKVLGQGSFGVVYAAAGLANGEAVAVKSVDLLGKKKRQRSFAQEEVEMWRSVGSHPNVVQLRESFTDMQFLFIVMEECQCNLIEWLCEEFDTIHARMPWIMREMLLGIQACHDSMVVHRDVKPDNYLVSKGGARIMLSDFGLAARLPSKGGLRGACGTRLMMSPEMLSGKRYDTGTDMWSFAVSAYLIFFGELPYNPKDGTHDAMKRAVKKGKEPQWMQEDLFPGAEAQRDFLQPLLRRDPQLRASAERALEHPFLQNASQLERPAKRDDRHDTQETLAPIDASDVLPDLCDGEDTWSEDSGLSTK